jgi:release factor glutamine methyltransferase
VPNACITATDISESALAVADENAKRNEVSVRFLHGDLLVPVANETFDIVVSNPPYVPSIDRDSLAVEVREYEPAGALFAGDDGLDIYRHLIPAAFAVLAPGGFIALEIGYGQQEDIRTLLIHVGFTQIEFVADLQGIPRVAIARRA